MIDDTYEDTTDTGDDLDTDDPTTEVVADTDTMWDDDQPTVDDTASETSLGAGSKEEWSEHWFEQAVNGTCVPSSIAQIVSEYTGEEFPNEDAFVQYALDHGMFPDGDISAGMTADDGAAILEAAGVPATVQAGTLEELDQMLADGHGVMIAVDSGYWDPEQEALDEAAGTDVGADHCVLISEIDHEAGVVYLSDTGHPDGDMLAVPMDEFIDAWSESGNLMITADEPSPNLDHDTGDATTPAAPESSEVPDLDVPDLDIPDLTEPESQPSEPDSRESVIDVVVRELVTKGPWAVLPVVIDSDDVSSVPQD